MNTRNLIGGFAITMLILPVLTQAQETEQMTVEQRRAQMQKLPEPERQALHDSKRAQTRAQRESMTDEQRQARRDAKRSQHGTAADATRTRRPARTHEGPDAQGNHKQRVPGARANGDRQRNRSTS